MSSGISGGPVLSGAGKNWRLGNVQFSLIPSLLVGAVIGAWLGSKIALSLPEQSLPITFGILLILPGIHYFHGSRKTPASLSVSEWKP